MDPTLSFERNDENSPLFILPLPQRRLNRNDPYDFNPYLIYAIVISVIYMGFMLYLVISGK